jgi:hypothetical protein
MATLVEVINENKDCEEKKHISSIFPFDEDDQVNISII